MPPSSLSCKEFSAISKNPYIAFKTIPNNTTQQTMKKSQKNQKQHLNPCNDFAFKRIFADVNHTDRPIDFLNAALHDQLEAPIKTITLLDPTQRPETMDQKESTVDLLCKDQAGNRYIIEMQVIRDKGFLERAQYYCTKAFSSQLAPGDYYTDLKKIIFLGITDFNLLPEYENYRSTHAIVSTQTQVNHLDKIHFTFIELPKFRKYVEDHNLQVENMVCLQQWCHFLNCPPVMDIAFLEGRAHSDALKSACASMHRASLNEQDRFLYEAAEKRQLDWASSIYAAEQESRKEGEQVGLEKGRQEGEQVGLQKGKEEGRKEGRQEGEQLGLEKAQRSR